MFRLGTSAAAVVVMFGGEGVKIKGKKKRLDVITGCRAAKSSFGLRHSYAALRNMNTFLLKAIFGEGTTLSVHDITAALAVIRDDDVNLRVNRTRTLLTRGPAPQRSACFIGLA